MGKNKLCKVKIPIGSEDKLPIQLPEQRSGIVLGMTFIRLKDNYGLDDFCKYRNKNNNPDIYKEFIELQNNARNYKDMTQFLIEYSPKNGQPKNSEFQRLEIIRLKNKYNFEADVGHIKHIHAKPNGNSRTVIWGYIYDNIFEVLAIDTQHKSI